MPLKIVTILALLALPGALAACAEGAAKGTTATTADETSPRALGAKGTTPGQRRWIANSHTPPAGR